MVANVAAKMILIYPNITPVQIATAIKSSAQALGAGPVLDPRAAYAAALKLREEWVARI